MRTLLTMSPVLPLRLGRCWITQAAAEPPEDQLFPQLLPAG